MTEEDFQTIEAVIAGSLPDFYCATLADSPFARDSFAGEFMLPDDTAVVVDLNEAGLAGPDLGPVFFVGSDGGEEYYFFKLTGESSAVFSFELETGNHRLLAPSWDAFLEHLRETGREIAADEAQMRARESERRWWQFWK